LVRAVRVGSPRDVVEASIAAMMAIAMQKCEEVSLILAGKSETHQ